MQVLVVKSSSLGDIVHALPAVRAFKATHPEAEIDWLVERDLAPILYGQPVLRRVMPLDSRSPRRSPRSLRPYRQLMRDLARLRRVRYDLVFDLQRLIKSAVILSLIRAKRRVGFSSAACREPLASLAYSRRVRVHYYSDPVREQYLALLQSASDKPLSPPPPPYLAPDPLADQSMSHKLGALMDQPYGVALLGVGFASKAWPFEHWVDLLDRLPSDYPVVLTWANQAERNKVLAASSLVRQTVVAPALTLRELTALLARARWVVGGDTGPLHLAAALDTPTLSFYGPTHKHRDAPPGHVAIQSPVECTGCFQRRCPKPEMDCLAQVTPEMVFQALEPML